MRRNDTRAIDQDGGKIVVVETPSKPEHIHLIFEWLVPHICNFTDYHQFHQGPRGLINPHLPIL